MTYQYVPVSCEFYDEVAVFATEQKTGKIHYFKSLEEKVLASAEGPVSDIVTEHKVEYLTTRRDKIRLDRVVSIFGRPGPAFEIYQSFGNSCED
jgi:transcriptional antiterminator Rof (Rho-off)